MWYFARRHHLARNLGKMKSVMCSVCIPSGGDVGGGVGLAGVGTMTVKKLAKSHTDQLGNPTIEMCVCVFFACHVCVLLVLKNTVG